MTIENLYQIYQSHPQVCTDTRTIAKGCLFFALKGDNFNGNTFAEQALVNGAAYAIVDEASMVKSGQYILVTDVLSTLQELAKHHRKQLKTPFIGITGTNGKTTTKELLRSVLSQRFSTYATAGNLNNHIGVPLTLLAITPDIEIAIIEMGANHQKEIGFLSTLAQPTHGLITNVGKAHLEGFGGFEGVKKGKGELYGYLQHSGGIAFINQENVHLHEMSANNGLTNIVFYGNTLESTVKGSIIANDPLLAVKWTANEETYIAKTNLTGIYNLENVLAAIAVGLHFKLSAAEINTGVESYIPGNNRSQITKTAFNTLICDYYNANPSSMAVALENFYNLQEENKVLILGDMFELGNESSQEHLNVLNKADSIKAEDKFFIGKEFFEFKDKFNAHFFENTPDAIHFISGKNYKGATILLKGSRGMKLEQLKELL